MKLNEDSQIGYFTIVVVLTKFKLHLIHVIWQNIFVYFSELINWASPVDRVATISLEFGI